MEISGFPPGDRPKRYYGYVFKLPCENKQTVAKNYGAIARRKNIYFSMIARSMCVLRELD